MMITLRAVAGIGMPLEAAPWSVASREPFTWLTLSGDCDDEEIGLFVATIADLIDVPSPAGPDSVVDALAAAEFLIAAGGLSIHDTETGATVTPGCCFGLENWREWAETLSGTSPWLGHDPDPTVEFHDATMRIWQDARRSPVHVDVRRPDFPELLVGVHHGLVGFLDAMRGWAQRTGLGSRGEALASAIDRSFAISPELDLQVRSARI